MGFVGSTRSWRGAWFRWFRQSSRENVDRHSGPISHWTSTYRATAPRLVSKGGERTFTAVCAKVGYADISGPMHLRRDRLRRRSSREKRLDARQLSFPKANAHSGFCVTDRNWLFAVGALKSNLRICQPTGAFSAPSLPESSELPLRHSRRRTRPRSCHPVPLGF